MTECLVGCLGWIGHSVCLGGMPVVIPGPGNRAEPHCTELVGMGYVVLWFHSLAHDGFQCSVPAAMHGFSSLTPSREVD